MRLTITLVLPLLSACALAEPEGRAGAENRLAVDRISTAEETFIGRTIIGRHLYLLTDSGVLVTLQYDTWTATRRTITGFKEQAGLWGLARDQDGTLWTLQATTEMAAFTQSGSVTRIVRLETPAMGLFGWNARFVFQPVPRSGAGPALVSGRPDLSEQTPFGSLKLAPFEAGAAETAVLNSALCGLSEGGRLPCWMAVRAIVDRIDVRGGSTLTILDALRRHERLDVRTVGQMTVPIKDAFVTRHDELWVLTRVGPSSGAASPEDPGRHLWRFSTEGLPKADRALTQSYRAILRAERDICHLLTIDGAIVRLRMP